MIDPQSLDVTPKVGRSYRIGLIGAGAITTTSHLPAYRSQGWDIVRIASRTESSAKRAASLFHIPKVSDRFLDVIEDPDVEVVDISLPPHLHRKVCEAAFAAGKHVLVQKPMATTLSDARAMVRAAERAGVKFAVNQNGRWDPAMRACKELLRRGVFGTLVTATVELRIRGAWQRFWEDAEHYQRLMILGMSVHHLDQFRFLFGEPEEVTAITQTYPKQKWQGDGIAFYALRYASGLVAYGFDDGYPWIRDWSVKFRIEGEGAIAMGEFGWPTVGFSSLRYTERATANSWVEPAFAKKWFPDAFVGTMGELFRAIETGDEPSISGRDNLRTLGLVEAAYRSASEKRTVKVEEIKL